MTFAERLKSMRKKRNLTQKELADILGIPYQGISQYERGVRQPKYQTIERIAKALDCRTSDLLDSSEEYSMIIDALSEELKARRIRRTEGYTPDGDEIQYAYEELQSPGASMQRYIEFAMDYSYVLNLIALLGIKLSFVGQNKVIIRRGDSEVNTRISKLVKDLENICLDHLDGLIELFKGYGLVFDAQED